MKRTELPFYDEIRLSDCFSSLHFLPLRETSLWKLPDRILSSLNKIFVVFFLLLRLDGVALKRSHISFPKSKGIFLKLGISLLFHLRQITNNFSALTKQDLPITNNYISKKVKKQDQRNRILFVII